MILAARRRLSNAADMVKDYVTGEGPRCPFREAENDDETANNVATVAAHDDVSNAAGSSEQVNSRPDNTVGLRKTNNFAVFIPYWEINKPRRQRLDRHLFFQGIQRLIFIPFISSSVFVQAASVMVEEAVI